MNILLTILYTFYLVTAPTPRFICSLWVSTNPTYTDILSACGSIDVNGKELRVIDLQTTQTLCTLQGAQIYTINQDCRYTGRLALA